jgi:hypothetical protein
MSSVSLAGVLTSDTVECAAIAEANSDQIRKEQIIN